jgi:hypothetical protein
MIPARDRNYQFKVTLRDIKPPIWRRIQVRDCTLDKLQERIQTAMGWTNSHLHHFKINDSRYGDRWLLDENFVEMNYKNSRPGGPRGSLPWGSHRSVRALSGIRLVTS